ncbi:hypothetical protein B0H12DRAFT_1103248 [Mycena haematopus]|nr:hypothetical protein B0H12DRAFT_1103248 [Mycena haematopus]
MEATSICGFLHGHRLFRIYSDSEEPLNSGATGPGPERATYIRGLNLRLSDTQRWAKSSGMYMRPTFDAVDGYEVVERITAFKVDGTWAALFLVQVGFGPDPLCPFLILAATQQNSKWIATLTLQYIQTLDPISARILAPWFAINAETVFNLPDDSAHPALLIALQYLEININEFTSPRNPTRQNAFHVTILCKFFFGHSNPWNHPEFLAFQDGFNIKLRSYHFLPANMMTHCSTLETFQSLIAGVYHRRINAVDDVIDRLEFYAPTTSDKLEMLRQQMFQLRFLRWIRGVGYPRSLRGNFIGARQFQAHKNDALVRAEALLYSMTSTLILPTDPKWKMKVNILRAFDQRTDTRSMGFHDCDAALDVFFNDWTDNALLQDVDFEDLEAETAFDGWMSSELSLPVGDYNDV